MALSKLLTYSHNISTKMYKSIWEAATMPRKEPSGLLKRLVDQLQSMSLQSQARKAQCRNRRLGISHRLDCLFLHQPRRNQSTANPSSGWRTYCDVYGRGHKTQKFGSKDKERTKYYWCGSSAWNNGLGNNVRCITPYWHLRTIYKNPRGEQNETRTSQIG